MNSYRVIYEVRPAGAIGSWQLQEFFGFGSTTDEALEYVRRTNPQLEFRFPSKCELIGKAVQA